MAAAPAPSVTGNRLDIGDEYPYGHDSFDDRFPSDGYTAAEDASEVLTRQRKSERIDWLLQT